MSNPALPQTAEVLQNRNSKSNNCPMEMRKKISSCQILFCFVAFLFAIFHTLCITKPKSIDRIVNFAFANEKKMRCDGCNSDKPNLADGFDTANSQQFFGIKAL